jgi:hypothetical protein
MPIDWTMGILLDLVVMIGDSSLASCPNDNNGGFDVEEVVLK